MSAKTEFDYLLNAMELAGHAERPLAAGYGDKRAALLEHVRTLEKDAERYRCQEKRKDTMERLEEGPPKAALQDIVRSAVRRMIDPIAGAIAEFVRVTDAASMAGNALRRAFLAFLTRGRGGKLPRSRSARGRAAVLKRAAVLRTRKRPNGGDNRNDPAA